MSGYIGVNGVARKIKKVYVGVDGVAREVKSGYVGVGGVAKKWYMNELLPPATSSYTVTEKVSGASYGFALNSSGYYESNNKGVNNSAAVCRVNLNLAAKSNITFTCINYAESNYDFGLLGNVDSALGTTNKVDSSVAKSFKGSSQAGTQTYTYSNVAAGEHFIDVKFRKDSSVNNNNDSLQFKIAIANA